MSGLLFLVIFSIVTLICALMILRQARLELHDETFAARLRERRICRAIIESGADRQDMLACIEARDRRDRRSRRC